MEWLRFEDQLLDLTGQPASWPRLALLGHPVDHSLSPRLHAAALRESSQDGMYAAVEVASSQLGPATRAAFEAGVEGVNLTVPHKRAVLDLVDRVAAEAEEIGAANTLVRQGSGWVAHNTDARGLAMALERLAGRRLREVVRDTLVLGNGGAARAAVSAVRALGARKLRVAARDPARSAWATAVGAECVALQEASPDRCSLLIQCTSLGLRSADPAPIDLSTADPELVVYDMVYGEHPTALLRMADGRGLVAQDGRSMLVAQAALAFSMWFGGLPPLAPMAASIGLEWKPA